MDFGAGIPHHPATRESLQRRSGFAGTLQRWLLSAGANSPRSGYPFAMHSLARADNREQSCRAARIGDHPKVLGWRRGVPQITG